MGRLLGRLAGCAAGCALVSLQVLSLLVPCCAGSCAAGRPVTGLLIVTQLLRSEIGQYRGNQNGNQFRVVTNCGYQNSACARIPKSGYNLPGWQEKRFLAETTSQCQREEYKDW